MGAEGGSGEGKQWVRGGDVWMQASDKPADTVQAEGYLQHTTRRSRRRERGRAHMMTKCVASLG